MGKGLFKSIFVLLTINFSSINLPKDHPVGLEDYISKQTPGRILIRGQDRLPGRAETDQHNRHNDYDIEHIAHLWGKRQRPIN